MSSHTTGFAGYSKCLCDNLLIFLIYLCLSLELYKAFFHIILNLSEPGRLHMIGLPDATARRHSVNVGYQLVFPQ